MPEDTTSVAALPQSMAIPENVRLGGEIWANLQTFELALRMANALSKSTVIPKEYQGNPSNTLIALEMAARMNTSPMQVMQNLFVINGRPSWSSQYIIAVINASRKYRHELKFALSGSGDSLSCYAWTTDNSGERIEGPTITMAMAKDEGWLARNGSKWKTMPEIMIRYRAAAFFGRLYCSDMIMGIYDREEIIELGPDEYEVITMSAEDSAAAEVAENANAGVIDAAEAVKAAAAAPEAVREAEDVPEAGPAETLPWDMPPDEPGEGGGQQSLGGFGAPS